MNRFDAVLFDLDGTLLYTLADIAAAVNGALREMRRPKFVEMSGLPCEALAARAHHQTGLDLFVVDCNPAWTERGDGLTV